MDIDVRSSEIRPNKPSDKRCAPSKEFKDGSCIELDVLIELVNAYNEEAGISNKKKIKMVPISDTLNPRKYKRYLIAKMKNRMSDVCDDQSCWFRQKFVKRMKNEAQYQLKHNTIRPSGPQGKFTWLSTTNIDDVIKQYEHKYDDFIFLGAVPNDFDSLPLGIKNLDFGKLKKEGKTKIGIVFNLDPHDKGGSHWVSSYSDLDQGFVYYFDSYGIRPDSRIRKYMKRVGKFIKDSTGKMPVVEYNHNRHQYKNSECGVYSISFILRMLQGKSFDELCGNKVKDDEINKCREKYFANVTINQ